MSWNEILATHQPHGQEITGGRVVDGNHGNNVEINTLTNHQDVLGNSSSSNKRRKKWSKVWEEMIKFTGADGRDRARCIHCEKLFDGSSKKGTTHLNNHLNSCRRKRSNGGEDADKLMDQTTNLSFAVVIKEKSVIDLIKNCFDQYGIPTECWDPSVLNSRKVEILQVYKEEKEKLSTVLNEIPCRFNLTIQQFYCWHILGARYIDNNWEPKMKIFSFNAVIEEGELDNNDHNLVKFLRESCLDLKIDGNIYYSISYNGHEDEDDFAVGDHEDVIGEINSWFSQRDNSLPFVGFLFSGHVLSLIYYNFKKNLNKWLRNKFGGISKCIDYVNSTQLSKHNFQIAVAQAKSMGKKVNTSDPFFGNSDFFYDFGTAVAYKEAFCELERIDSDFKSRSINLTKEDWDEAAVICQHYKELEASERKFSTRKYTTPNQYFPKFCDLYMKILPLQRTQLDEKTSIAREILASALEKYKLVLVIAVGLDPRFKIDIIQYWYNKIYGRDADRYFEKIMDDFANVYKKYAKVFESDSEDATTSYLDAMGRPCTSSHNMIFSSHRSSELARYLNEPKFPSVKKFDILAWWRAYTPIFPTLARMARDFLSLYVDRKYFRALIMDRTFRIARCVNYDEDLDEDIIPALLCLSEWLNSLEK